MPSFLSLHMHVQFYHHLLKKTELSPLDCLSSLSKISWAYLYGSTSELSILLQWSIIWFCTNFTTLVTTDLQWILRLLSVLPHCSSSIWQIFWVFCLSNKFIQLPVQCWIALLRGHILALFLILDKKHLVSHH